VKVCLEFILPALFGKLERFRTFETRGIFVKIVRQGEPEEQLDIIYKELQGDSH